MKKAVVSLLAVLLVISQPVFAQQAAVPDSQPQSSQGGDELERTRELLAIWKDHVRDLTQERDEAIAELEKTKTATSAPVSETAQAAPAASNEEVQNLTRAVENLKAENSSLQRNSQKMKAEIVRLQSVPQPVVSQQMGVEQMPIPQAVVAQAAVMPAGPTQAEFDTIRRELGDLKPRLAPLQAEILRLQNENAQVKQDMAKVSDAYSAAKASSDKQGLLEKQIRESAEDKNVLIRDKNKMAEEINALRAQIGEAHKNYETLKTVSQQDVLKQSAQADEAMKGLKSQIVRLIEENDALKKQNAEVGDLRADVDVARQAYSDLETRWRSHDQDTNDKIQSLTAESERLRSENTTALASLQKLTVENGQIRPLQADLEKVKGEKAQLEQYIGELKSVQGDQQKQIDELEVKLSTVNIDVEGFRTQVNGVIDNLEKKYTPKR